MERLHAPTAETIDLADIFRSIRNGWLIVALVTVATTAIAIAILLFAPPSFSGKASVVLKTGTNGGSGGGLAAAIGSLTEMSGGGGGGGALAGLKSGVETEIEILKSRALAAEVVDSLDLQAVIAKPAGTPVRVVFSDVALAGSFKRRAYTFTPVANGLYHFRSATDSGQAKVGEPVKLQIGSVTLAPTPPAGEFKVMFRDREDATTRLVDKFTIGKPKSEVAHIEYRGDDSISAAAVPNLAIELYMLRRRGVDRGTNQKRAEFLAAKVDSVAKALTAAERALRLERESSGVIDPELVGRVAFENENRLRTALTEIQVQEVALQQLLADVRAGKASARQLASYPPYLGAGPVSNIVSTLIGVENERLSLLAEVTEEDVRVKALGVRAKNLESQLLPLAQTSLAALSTQRESIQSRLKTVESALGAIPGEAESYGRLQRDIIERGKIYAGLQTELVAARLGAISEGGDVRTLDPAVVQKKRAFPKPSIMLAGGVGGGMFLGVIAAVLVGLIGGSMHDAQDVERRTGLAAVRFESSAPLLVGGPASRTILVAPINERGSAKPVAERVVETAISRSMTATLLDLSSQELRLTDPSTAHGPLLIGKHGTPDSFDANAAIRRLEETHDLVVVRLPALTSHQAGAVLSSTRPVILVAPERRIERRSLQSAIDLLRRVGAPCAGVVLHGDDRRALRG